MAKIVLAWEMGANLGHITRLTTLANTLCSIGHSVTLILNTTSDLTSEISPQIQIIQGPSWPDKKIKLSRPPANLSEVILAMGYHNSQKLCEHIQQWQALFIGLSPDLIIFDYAPTATLASRGFDCKTLSIDDPFSKPPETHPIPAFEQTLLDSTASISIENLTHSDNALIDKVNKSLSLLGLKPITFVYDIFKADSSLLLSVSAMDPYAELRINPQYLGALSDATAIHNPLIWASKPEVKKIFAYLKQDYPQLNTFIQIVKSLNVELKLFLPNASQNFIQHQQTQLLQIASTPFDLNHNLTMADAVVCHGGHSTTYQALNFGVPVLFIPLQQEQLMTAKRCIENNLGVGLGPNSNQDKIKKTLEDLLFCERYKNTAKQFQKNQKNLCRQTPLEAIIDHCVQVLAKN